MRHSSAGGLIMIMLALSVGWMQRSLAQSRPDAELTLYVGAVSTQRLGKIASVVVGNDALLSATLLENDDLILLPKAPGTTDIAVRSVGHEERLIKVRIVAPEVYNNADLVSDVMSHFPDIRVRRSGDTNILTGTVSLEEYEQFQRLVGDLPLTISLVKPKLALQVEDVIAMDVKILEINKQYQRNVGIRWQDTGPGPAIGTVANLAPSNRFGVVSNVGGLKEDLLELLGAVGTSAQTPYGYFGFTTLLSSELQLLQENGTARILAEPTLSTLSGKPAKFTVGGEIPVAVFNQFGQPIVEFREYGIQIEINPIIDEALNIRSEIRAEISSVDFSTQVNGIPGLLSREVQSTINARPGDTIAISGLVSANDSRNVDKLPWLGDIPIIGALFRSKDFQQQRTELLVLVTPRVQRPNAPLPAHLQEHQRQLRGVLNRSIGLDKKLIE